MKKLFLLSTIYYLLSTSLFAQETFFRFVSGWENHNIQELDNSYISCGTATLNSDHIIFTEGMSLFGDSIFSYSFYIDTASATYHIKHNSIVKDGNVNYSASYFRGEVGGKYQAILLKFNEDFSDTLYSKVYNTLADDGSMLWIIEQKNDTSLILGSYNYENNNSYATFLEVDTIGNIRWQKDFDCSGDCNMKPFHILPTEDNGFIFTCFESHINGMPGTEEFQTAVIKTDSVGNTQWRHTWGGDTTKNFGSWVVPLDDGNFLYAWTDNEYTGWNAQSNYDNTVRFAKFDINGNVIWFKDISEQLEGRNFSITQMELMPNGNIIIAGYNGVWGGLIKVDQEANLIWYRGDIMPPGMAYEDNTATQQQMKILGVTFTSDDGFILAGEYISSEGNLFPDGIQSAYAYKLDEYGCYDIGCSVGLEEEEIITKGFSIYPNPANEEIIITCNSCQSGEFIQIYNLIGNMIKQFKIHNSEIRIQIGDLQKGIYLIKIGTETKKLIIE